ncbi:MAG: site-2 protease family protein [Candidatus Berkelbacteria bacterium]
MLLLGLIQNPFIFLAYIVALIIGITVHEYAHAWMAHRCGDDTAKFEGRLTLNPLAHLDPLGTVMLFVVGFGWGKPVPINPNNMNKKSDELKVAFAGIVTNLILAFILAIPIRIALMQGILIESSAVLSFLNIIVDLNIILAVFNILPIPPLDGSHLVEYFLNRESKYAYQTVGPFILIGVIIAESVTHISIIHPIMEPIIRLLSLLIKGSYNVIL